MEYSEIISLVALFLFWLGGMITMWVRLNIKLTELELKIKVTQEHLDTHIKWGQDQQHNNLARFEQVNKDAKDSYNNLSCKLDTILKEFGNFRVYAEKNFKR